MEAPVSRSRLEINFIRLLEETQQMANENKPKEWTFEKFVQWLELKIPEMEKSPNAPNEETLKHYKRQVDFLKGVIVAEKCPEVLDCAAVSQLIPHGPATTDHQVITQQIHQRSQVSTTNRLRQELLGLDSNLGSRGGSLDIATDDFQNQLMTDEQKRDKMVEDMIAMTREWKEQSKLANKIIKKDIDVIDKSVKLADGNQSHLKVESNRLQEFNKRACNFWIWIMIIIVCFTFISMVMFIRIFRKKQVVL